MHPPLCKKQFNVYDFTHGSTWNKAMKEDDIGALRGLNYQFFDQQAGLHNFDILLKIRRKAVELEPSKNNYYLLGRHLLYYKSQKKPFSNTEGMKMICLAQGLGSKDALYLIESKGLKCP